jgi:hypothetical protein
MKNKIYRFHVSGYEMDVKIDFKHKEYFSDSDFKNLVARLFVEESEYRINQLKENCKDWDEDDVELYRSISNTYYGVIKRLEDLGFKENKPSVSFTTWEMDCMSNDNETSFEDMKLVRDEFKQYIREQKIKRIIK